LKMKVLLHVVVCAALAGATFGGVINISTGTNNAIWQVSGPGIAVPVTATSLTVAQQNGTWAPAPISISPISGANWVSYSSVQGTSCVVGQTPGNGCANTLANPNGDTWTYSLTISAASLGATSGTLNFIFGADNRVVLGVGNGGPSEAWNTGAPTNGNAFNPLGCSGTPPTSAGNTQAQYNNCVGTVSFSAGNLNGDGSVTLTALVANDPIVGCPTCGDPTGFVLEGTLSTTPVTTPEPATFALVGLAGLAGIVLRRRR
jgi:hypothetical protein